MTNTLARHSRPQAQRGQAMTEFVVGAVFFLLPMFLIIPMIGKYADVKATSVQAARYVAWERTVWYGGSAASTTWPANAKSEDEVQKEARRRVVEFGQKIADNDKGQTSFANDGGRFLWRNRDGSKMLQNYDDALASSSNDWAPDTVTKYVLGPVTTVTAVLGFHLETKGLYGGKSSIPVFTKPIGSSLDGGADGKFDPGTLTFTDTNYILANGWGAGGKGHVKSQTVGLAPLGLLGDATLGPALQIVGCAAMVAFAPEFCWLEIGKIEPDVVPPDRLTP